MAQYIDKSALVAEIERRKNICNNIVTTSETPVYVDYYQGKAEAYKETIDLLSTLEVKEVDLEHEVESYWKQCDMTWCRDAYSMTHIRSMLSDIAKHFYELGMAVSNNAQKGEKV